ncbi:unnamed protein product [Lepeophtheirus salmonis]|uniref:(salmon louse) hypothetical protein n=1 Tax=Lepeophtheirus salmonis TaxID=72036 RepID=A0A7R8D528_LEPSM|nr:unnamed protein product [Lepeophtheirus salmonis]CAF2976659.1 unnamed protein product [Lepeophtheirus salmonis]
MDTDRLRADIVNETFLQKVLFDKYDGKIELVSFESKPGSQKGDNFIGDLVAVDFKKNGLAYALRIFDREEYFYTTFINDLNKYVKKDILNTIPFIYSINEKKKEALVFQHLGKMGFRDPVNKKEGGHEAWCKDNFVSEAGKFSMFEGMCDMMKKSYFQMFQSLLNGSENDSFVKQFEIKCMFQDRNSKFFVMAIRGLTNIMFKYDENGNIIDTIFLDMQMIYCGNLGSDLSYFLCTCVTYETLSDNLDDFLHYYYKCLTKHIRELDPSITEIPLTLEDIKHDFLKSSLVGFFVAFNAFPFILSKKEDFTDFEFTKVDFKDKEELEGKTTKEFAIHSNKVIFEDTNVYNRMLNVRFFPPLSHNGEIMKSNSVDTLYGQFMGYYLQCNIEIYEFLEEILLKDVKTAWSSEEPTGECSLDLVLLKDEKVSEKIRFRFDSRWGTLSKREIGEDVYYQGIEREFRGIVRKITQVLSKSEDENRAFHETNSENSFIFHFYSNDEKHLSHWITVQESISLFRGKPTILPIRKIFTPFKLEVASEIMC